MKKDKYLPRPDDKRVKWLNDFAAKLPTHAATLNVSAAELTSVQNDAAMFAYLVSLVGIFITEKEERVNYKDLMRDGPIGTPAGDFPDMPLLGTPPTAVAPGIFPRISKIVGRIKNHDNYNDAIGKDLGIIGSEQILDDVNMKPVLKLTLAALKVNVGWKKGNATAIRIEKAIGTGDFAFLAIDTEPDYLDTTALPATATVWRYRAIYMIGDDIVGQMSDEVKITVGA